jgi:hypothetical protein
VLHHNRLKPYVSDEMPRWVKKMRDGLKEKETLEPNQSSNEQLGHKPDQVSTTLIVHALMSQYGHEWDFWVDSCKPFPLNIS